MVEGNGMHEGNMDKTRPIEMQSFQETIRLLRFPLTFVMVEDVKTMKSTSDGIDFEDVNTGEDDEMRRRMKVFLDRRKEIKKFDKNQKGDGADLTVAFTVLAFIYLPTAILYHWSFESLS